MGFRTKKGGTRHRRPGLHQYTTRSAHLLPGLHRDAGAHAASPSRRAAAERSAAGPAARKPHEAQFITTQLRLYFSNAYHKSSRRYGKSELVLHVIKPGRDSLRPAPKAS